MRRSGPTRPRRITLVNQFYPPDLAPTAHLTRSLAEHLADGGAEVTVVTAGEGYTGERSAGRPRPHPGKVQVVHLWTPVLGKGSVLKRLSDYLTFLAGAIWQMVRLPRQDVVISLTTPPFVVLAALAHRLRHRHARVVLWSMDCYPDVIESLGSRTEVAAVVPAGSPRLWARLWGLVRSTLRPLLSLRRGGPLSGLLRGVNRWAFRRLDHVVALDKAMRDLLTEGYGDDGRPAATVIPNWERRAEFPAPVVDDPDLAPWPGYVEAPLAGRFVALYLGNLGFGHRTDTLLEAMAEVAAGPGRDEVAWLFVGGGVRFERLRARAEARGLGAGLVQHPYVPKGETPAVMAGAGCAVILLADEARGLMSPSKLHANLAAGLPILYVGPEGSNVDDAITRFGCGVSLRNGDAAGVAAAVERLRTDAAWRAELSANARRAFETAYCDEATLPRWDAVLDQVLDPS